MFICPNRLFNAVPVMAYFPAAPTDGPDDNARLGGPPPPTLAAAAP